MPSTKKFGEADDAVERRAQLVRHVGQKTVFALGGLLQLDIFLLQRLLHALAVGDVADGAGDQHAFLRLERAETDFHRKFGPVLAQPVKIKPRAHGPRARLGEKTLAMAGMVTAETFGHQNFDRLTEQLLPGIAEELLRLGIHQHDAPSRLTMTMASGADSNSARNFCSAFFFP